MILIIKKDRSKPTFKFQNGGVGTDTAGKIGQIPQQPTNLQGTSGASQSNTLYPSVSPMNPVTKPLNQVGAVNNLIPTQPQVAIKPRSSGLTNAAGLIGAAGMLAGTGAGMLDTTGATNRFGYSTQNVKKSAAKGALTGAASGAAMGATVGSIIPVWGTAVGGAIGGVVGGVTGLLKGKKRAKGANTRSADSTQKAYEDYAQKAAAAQYASLKRGGAMAINKSRETLLKK